MPVAILLAVVPHVIAGYLPVVAFVRNEIEWKEYLMAISCILQLMDTWTMFSLISNHIQIWGFQRPHV